MDFTPASQISILWFISLMVLVMGFVIKEAIKVKGHKNWLALFLLLTTAISLSAYFDYTSKHIIPLLPIYFFGVIIYCFLLTFSNYGKNLCKQLSFTMLLGLQVFRLPLEFILHSWGDQGTIPLTMTWSGQNMDFISGIICLVSIPFLEKSKIVVWAVQLISFSLLLNVLRVVIMSSPLPFSWNLDNPLQLIFYMPYALIVPCFVAIALICHLLVFRKLLKTN